MTLKFRTLLVLIAMFCLTGNMIAQDILMTIGDKEITLDEFERIYNKNNSSISNNQQSPEEYLDLFVNFKLKVLEAENQGMDTTAKFLNEFNSYKDQLAKPYLTDEESLETMIREAYDRMQVDIHVSHILLKMGSQAPPEDTLMRYNLAMEIRQRIINGEDFATVARATSEDPSVINNGGDLGFFTAFMMLYPFENAAYNLKDGEVSMPVRTMHGYHILFRHETRPAIGQVKVAHIFIRVPEGTTTNDQMRAKESIQMVSDSIAAGADFATLASRYSDDRNSALNGGELPWFGTGRMIREFEEKAFELKNNGEVTKPFRTFYGWHIIKLIDKKGIGSFEDMRSDIQSRVAKGDRDLVKQNKFIARLKENYNYKLDTDVFKKLYSMVDSSIYQGLWDPKPFKKSYDEVLFYTNAKNVTVGEFLSYLSTKQKKRNPLPVENFVDGEYNKFLEEFLMSTEKESLPERFPEYKYILQEYHDGILLFDLMDEKVWSYAVKDTTGLEQFYKDHKKNYMWGERTAAKIVSCDPNVDIQAVMGKASKIGSGKWDAKKLNEKFGTDSISTIQIEDLVVEEGRNEHVDALNSQPGTGQVYTENGLNKFVIVTAKVPPVPKKLDETRGQVTSDYQDFLEKKWIEELRAKYPVSINKELLSKIETNK